MYDIHILIEVTVVEFLLISSSSSLTLSELQPSLRNV